MAFLQELGGSRTYALERPSTLLGRDAACDIVLGQSQASSRHALVLNLEGRYFVEDLRSLNGTFVNGHKIHQRTLLAPGDRLAVPGLTLTLHTAETKTSAGPTTMKPPPAPAVPPTIISSLDITAGPRPEVAPEAKLRAVLEIARALGRTLALQEVLPTLLQSLFTIFPQAHRGFILLRDAESGQLTPVAVRQQGAQDDAPVARSETLIQHAVATGQAILSADVGQDARFKASESLQLLHLHSVLCVPLVSQTGASLGVIQIDSRDRRHPFAQEDLEVLLCASTQVAQAIELARFHEELRDLEAATRIQQSFLPGRPPDCPDLQFFDHYVPARQVGGDYFDYIPLPGHRLAIAIGDVAGKGVSAALLMARLGRRTFLPGDRAAVTDAVRRLNLALARDFEDGRFVTFLVAVLDLDSHALTLVIAGHPPPLLVRAGQVEAIGAEAAGILLAGIDRPYQATSVHLAPGDMVLCYTDGIDELRGPEGELYGLDRLLAAARRGAASPEQLGAAVLADVRQFTAGRPLADDQTLVCFGVRSGP